MKTLSVHWSPTEACDYYVDLNQFSRAHDHSDHITLDAFSGTYRFDKISGKVTLDTGVEIRDISVNFWFLYDE